MKYSFNIFCLAFLFFLNNSFASNKYIDKAALQTLSTFSLAKNVEIDFMIKPSYSNHHIFQINYSTDWFFDSFKNDERYTSGFAFSSGILFEFSNLDLSGLIGYIKQTGYNNRVFNSAFEHESFYLDINPKIKSEYLFMNISARVYLNEVLINYKYERFSFHVGVGVFLF